MHLHLKDTFVLVVGSMCMSRFRKTVHAHKSKARYVMKKVSVCEWVCVTWFKKYIHTFNVYGCECWLSVVSTGGKDFGFSCITFVSINIFVMFMFV